QLTGDLDGLGRQPSSRVGIHHTRFSSAALSDKVMEGLPGYSDIVRRAHHPEPGFQAARDLALQALAGIDDDPRQKLLIKLREWHFPSPFGRSSMGKKDNLEKLTIDLAKADYARRYHAKDAIIALAGNVDFDKLKDAIAQHFG